MCNLQCLLSKQSLKRNTINWRRSCVHTTRTLIYPIPFMRWPIPLAKAFGRKVFKHRWFALVYILLTFFILPVYVSSKKYSFFHYIHFKLVPSPSVLIENNFLGCWTIIFSKFCSTIYWSYCSNYQHITYCNYQCYASYETNLASK